MKKRTLLLLGLGCALVFTGCGKEGEEASEQGAEKPQTMVIGTISSGEPWGYLDKDGNLTGYEIDVLKAVDEKLEQYEFDIQGSTFQNILTGLGAGKFDLGTHMFEFNEERGAKYLYGKEGHIDYSTYFILPADSEYTTWESLAGKTVGTEDEKNNYALMLEAYNKKNPDKAINIDYYGEITDEATAKSLADGRWDAVTQLGWTPEQWNKEFFDGKEVFKLGDQIGNSLAYYLYPRDGKHEQFQKDVDQALKELKEEGVLKDLSMHYFGFDITPREE